MNFFCLFFLVKMSLHFTRFTPFLRSLGLRGYSTVLHCPPPTYDTGCTHCEVPTPDLFNEHKTPTNTRAFHSKHLLLTYDRPQDPTTWPSKLELVPDTFTQEFTRFKRKMLDPEYPVLVTSTDLAPPSLEKTDVGFQTKKSASGYLFPEGKYFNNIDLDKTPEFIKQHLVPKEGQNGEPSVETPESSSATFSSEPMDHSLILICGHKMRDSRCGEIAPLLVNEFNVVLKNHDLLYNQHIGATGKNRYRVGICSHIGGHVYAGNVLIMIPGTLGIWYGNVRPFHVQGIVQETLINRNIIQELHRGGRF